MSAQVIPFLPKYIAKYINMADFEKTKSAKPALAFRLVEEIKASFRFISLHFFKVGVILLFLKQDGLFLSYAEGHIYNWEQFCKEIGIGKSTAYNLMKIVVVFGNAIEAITAETEELDKFPIDYTRLARLLPYTRDKSDDELKDMIVEARELTPIDFEAKVRELGGKTAYYNCNHEITVEIIQCKECGLKWEKQSAS